MARYVQFPKISYVQSITNKLPGSSLNVDQAEQMHPPEPNSDAAGRGATGEEDGQADQLLRRPPRVGEEAELNSHAGEETSKSLGAAGDPDQVRAEQRMLGEGYKASSSYLIAKSIRQCHTRPWPVDRYVDLPITSKNVQELITNFDKGHGQAEQMSRAGNEDTFKEQASGIMDERNTRLKQVQ